MDRGYVQVYTGNGKGKTTAALGLALRAIGAGMKVFIGQFAKGQPYSELNSIAQHAQQITLRQYGTERFIEGQASGEDTQAAWAGWQDVQAAVSGGAYDLVVLDEINIAVLYGLVTVDELLTLIHDKPANMELVLTGRYAHPKITMAADLVTEMREVKHYYHQGVMARVGIEN